MASGPGVSASAGRLVRSSVRADGTRPIWRAHNEKETSWSKFWASPVRRTTGTRPRPPAMSPSARRAASAWRTVPRETANWLVSRDSEGSGAPGVSSPERICSRRACAIAACRGRVWVDAILAAILPPAVVGRSRVLATGPSQPLAELGRDPLHDEDDDDQDDHVRRHRLEAEDVALVVDENSDAAAALRPERHRRTEVGVQAIEGQPGEGVAHPGQDGVQEHLDAPGPRDA